ncbi:MAG: YbaB/EbfC family nucleoid-associated protein [Firmicutes bacterium]|nr:YbaB/EbfC family nucleoid-associated protein [Bacillota bacterium]
MGKGMKAGKKPGVKKNNQMAQMQQIQAMQRRMEDAQSAIEVMETEASAGGGAVTVKVNGKHELVAVTLKPEIVDPDDIEMLQDLIVAAANEAMRQIDEISQQEMSKVTGSLGLPAGLF